MYDVGHSIGPKLSSIIRDGSWFWPIARSEILEEIQSRLLEVILGEVDKPVWGTKGGVFSCAETLEELRVKKPTVEWHEVVWFTATIPKHAFFPLASFSRLLLLEKRCVVGDIMVIVSVFSIGLNRKVWLISFFSVVLVGRFGDLSWLIVRWWILPLIVRWSSMTMKGKGLHSTTRKLCFAATVYNLWMQRNLLLHGRTPKTKEESLSRIKWEVRVRLLAKFSLH
jgi:hypothetical protein